MVRDDDDIVFDIIDHLSNKQNLYLVNKQSLELEHQKCLIT